MDWSQFIIEASQFDLRESKYSDPQETSYISGFFLLWRSQGFGSLKRTFSLISYKNPLEKPIYSTRPDHSVLLFNTDFGCLSWERRNVTENKMWLEIKNKRGGSISQLSLLLEIDSIWLGFSVVTHSCLTVLVMKKYQDGSLIVGFVFWTWQPGIDLGETFILLGFMSFSYSSKCTAYWNSLRDVCSLYRLI